MQGLPFNLPLEPYPQVLPTETDTASPRFPIPIYYIHCLARPFCRDFHCQCHRKQREVAKLLGLIHEGIMTLNEAAELMEGGTDGTS